MTINKRGVEVYYASLYEFIKDYHHVLMLIEINKEKEKLLISFSEVFLKSLKSNNINKAFEIYNFFYCNDDSFSVEVVCILNEILIEHYEPEEWNYLNK